MKKVLILAPHTDDGELGCGGTIARLVQEGNELHYAAFSVCEQSVPEGLPKDILEQEVRKATTVLGISQSCLHVFRYPVRRFNEHRQDILDDLVHLSRAVAFDMVFMPSRHDTHQDHTVIADEGRRAFKHTTILSYELPWNQFTFDSMAFFGLNAQHLEMKCEALKQYTSQQGRRAYMSREFIEALARVRGVQIQRPFAEAFEVIRWVN